MQSTRYLVARAFGAVSIVAGAVLAAAGPATAADQSGAASATSGDQLLTWVILIGVPVIVVAVIALLSLAPTWTQTGRYNPGAGWFAEPLWLGGPDSDVPALPAAGAASHSTELAVKDPGGVSASW
jgi:hypothetical protein